ncbi:MAG: biopolymer transporter ExbD [Bacteroidales bacterium]|jgi:biopolymer transport protein ExbD|nr:biopolymer transporter ExbD [Bacteroidales bacterium]
MAIRSSNKISPSFSMSSMTDLVFLLLIFFMITSTLVSPNALKLLLPQSNNQTSAKAITSVSITRDFRYFVETAPVSFSDLERQLQLKLREAADPTISLHVDKSVPMEEVVKVMNIAVRNKYKLILATAPERK